MELHSILQHCARVDWATTTGNMHRKFGKVWICGSWHVSGHRHTSEYSAPLAISTIEEFVLVDLATLIISRKEGWLNNRLLQVTVSINPRHWWHRSFSCTRHKVPVYTPINGCLVGSMRVLKSYPSWFNWFCTARLTNVINRQAHTDKPRYVQMFISVVKFDIHTFCLLRAGIRKQFLSVAVAGWRDIKWQESCVGWKVVTVVCGLLKLLWLLNGVLCVYSQELYIIHV